MTYISKQSLIAVVFALFTTLNLYAGNSVSGKVQDSSSNNLPDIGVKVVGTQNKTVTDANGDFKLDIGKAKRVSLYFSAKGYYSKTNHRVVPGKKVAVKLKPIPRPSLPVPVSPPPATSVSPPLRPRPSYRPPPARPRPRFTPVAPRPKPQPVEPRPMFTPLP